MSDSVPRSSLTIILSAAGLVMVAFGSFVTLQSTSIDRRMESLNAAIGENRNSQLRKDEHVEFKYRVDRDMTRIEHEIERLQNQIDQLQRELGQRAGR